MLTQVSWKVKPMNETLPPSIVCSTEASGSCL